MSISVLVLFFSGLLCYVTCHRVYSFKIKNEQVEEELENVVGDSITNPGDDSMKVSHYGSNDSTPPTTPTV